jgi:hypothetical protein
MTLPIEKSYRYLKIAMIPDGSDKEAMHYNEVALGKKVCIDV